MADAAQPWPIWAVTITDGFYTSTSNYPAPSRGAARFEAFRHVSDVWDIDFRSFLAICSVRRASAPAVDGYDYVRRAYNVDARLGRRVTIKNEGRDLNGRGGVIVYPNKSSTAYVHVVLDGESRVSIVHPRSVDLIDPAPADPAIALPAPLAPLEIPF